jgi:hypothetical protein
VLRRSRRQDVAGADELRGARPLPDDHRDELEARMDLLRMAVELEDACEFGDLPGRERPRHDSFLAHFPELAEPIAEWNACVERVRSAPAELWTWLETAARLRGITEPPYALGTLIDRLAVLTAERSRNGELALAHELRVESFRDRVGGIECVSLLMDGQTIARLPCAARDGMEPDVPASVTLVQSLYDEARTTREAIEVGGVRDALLDIKQPLLDELAAHASADSLAFTSGCPVCARALEQEREVHMRAAGPGGLASAPDDRFTPGAGD